MNQLYLKNMSTVRKGKDNHGTYRIATTTTVSVNRHTERKGSEDEDGRGEEENGGSV